MIMVGQKRIHAASEFFIDPLWFESPTMLNEESFFFFAFEGVRCVDPPQALDMHVGRRMSWEIEVVGHGLITLVSGVSKMFLEPSSEGSASFSNVDLVTCGTRNSINYVFCVTREVSGNVDGVLWAVNGGRPRDEGAHLAVFVLAG